MTKTVLFMNGSLRKGSFNQAIIEYVATELQKRGINTKQLDYSEVPFMNQDIEFPAPASVVAVREQVAAADALWIVTPEYNGSVPAGLKNMLDWTSRPVEQGQFGAPDFFKDKLVAVSGAAGRSGASLVIAELTGLLTRMATKPLATTAGIVLPAEAWQTGVLTLTDEHKTLLDGHCTPELRHQKNTP